MRGSADRRSARPRFHGWKIFSLAAFEWFCLRPHSRLTFVATTSMPALLRWRPCHRRESCGGLHARRRWLSPTGPLPESLARAARFRASHRKRRWNVFPIPPRVEITLSATRFARRLCWNINTRSSARMDTGFPSAASLCGRWFS